MLDYKLLDALAHVVQEGGFEKAAKALHLTQSAVSQRVRQLEEQAGMVLLTRSLPPRPTPGGEALLKHYIQVSHLETDLEEQLERKDGQGYRSLAIGINADSLSTWFYPAVSPFIQARKVVLDLRVDDQDQTRKMLKAGEVLGCISSEKEPLQGCSVTFIGTMVYRMAATPAFKAQYFPEGLTLDGLKTAPAVIYNHKDDLHTRYLKQKFGSHAPDQVPAHFFPSPEQFLGMILTGTAYGMIPDLQAGEGFKEKTLVDLDPDFQEDVDLFWHRWNIRSSLLEDFSTAIVKNARIF